MKSKSSETALLLEQVKAGVKIQGTCEYLGMLIWGVVQQVNPTNLTASIKERYTGHKYTIHLDDKVLVADFYPDEKIKLTRGVGYDITNTEE